MSGHDYNPQHDAYLCGAPDYDELRGQYADRQARPEPMTARDRAIGRMFIRFAIGIVAVTLAVAAYGHGITTSDRPAICHNLTPADCVAMLQEAR